MKTAVDLHRRFAPDLRRLLVGLLRNQADADDALQRVFLKLLDSWENIELENAKSWLFTVAYREAATLRRRRYTDRSALTRLWQRPAWIRPQESQSQLGRLIDEEQTKRAVRLLQSLPPEQRFVVEQRVWHEKKFSEIAEELDIPLGTVLTRMRLALKKLKRLGEES